MTEPNEMAMAMEALYDRYDGEKRTWLSYRYSGFSFTEACDLAQVETVQVKNWIEEDAEFAKATRLLKQNGKVMRQQILEELRDRNERMFLELDGEVLEKAILDGGIENVSKDSLDYLKRARSVYNGGGARANTQVINIGQLIQERHDAKRQTDSGTIEGEGTTVEG